MGTTSRNPNTPGGDRRDRLIREREHDPYKVREKLPDPTACPDCGVLYRDGRWTWGAAPIGAHEQRGPACQRTHDDQPAGMVTIAGPFVEAHREELLGLARGVEERERREHPLKRIMATEELEDGVLVKTTDSHLARSIGDALHRAYEGELDYTYTEESALLRVRWSR